MNLRAKVLAGLLAVTVVGAGTYYVVNKDEIDHERELERRFDCPDLVPPLPSSLDAEAEVTGLRVEPLTDAEGVTAIAAHPTSGDLYVAEKTGRLLRVPTDGGEAELFLDLADTVRSEGNEQGLLGLAFDAGGTAMYLHYTDLDGDTAVDVHLLDAGGRSIEVVDVFRTEQPHMWHNGGAVLVDEADTVWISLGDGGLEIDRTGQGQDPTTVLGTLLRFDPADGHRSLVPAAGNPFIGTDEGAEAVSAYGLRNSWRLWMDEHRQRVVIADVGDNCFEEINVIGLDEPGANFGWRDVEGPWAFDGKGPKGAIEPRYSYPRGPEACAVIGGVGADRARYPTLEGRFLFSDLCATDILALDLDGDDPPVPLDIGVAAATTFATGLDGTIYVGSLSEGVVRLTAAAE